MILIRAALLKLAQTVMIGALAIGVLACLLLSYSYISGDRQDRAEMVATAEHAVQFFAGITSEKTRGHASSASLAGEN